MKILIAEDDTISRKLLESSLSKMGYDIVEVDNGRSAWDIIQQNDTPRLLILDWVMPFFDGIDLCKMIRKLQRDDYLYIILLTAKVSKEEIIEGLDSGADDYITKPFHPVELRARINVGERIIKLYEELLSTREALKIQATIDYLTQIWNRRSILDMLQNEIDRSHRTKKPLSVLIIDLDHFKKINDNYGHLIGDEIIQQASIRMKSMIRKYDNIGRYGGEEFLIISPDCNIEKGYEIAERIRESINSVPFQTLKGDIDLTVSIGVSSNSHIENISILNIVNHADTALYNAKNSGRNKIQLFTSDDVPLINR
jgi:two-component system, cell cycle response regulator